MTASSATPRRKIRTREVVWVAVAAFLIVYPVLGFAIIDLYQSGAMNPRWERPLVFGVFYPVWLISLGPCKSKFIDFVYRLETKSGGAIIQHDVWLSAHWNAPDPEAEFTRDHTNAAPDAFVLWSGVTRWTPAMIRGVEPLQHTEAEIRLTRQQGKAVEHAIRSWSGGRKDWHEVDDWYDPPFWERRHPVVLVRADINAELSMTGGREWRGYQLEAFGPVECSAARGLIQSINQALPASIRKHHALPLPPKGRPK